MSPAEQHRLSTDVAGLCKEMVLKKAIVIGKRKYVPVECWMAIATAHGCVASSRAVERVEGIGDMSGGFRATGEIRKISDGSLVAQAEGFVGEDEPLWFGGELNQQNQQTRKWEKKTLEKRPDFAIRAMAQTRAISRACRSAFAHVVVMMNANLETTPAEEVASDESDIDQRTVTPANDGKAPPVPPPEPRDWRDEVCTYGKTTGPLRGKKLGDLSPNNLEFMYQKFVVSGQEVEAKDRGMAAALKVWASTERKEQS